MKHSSRSKEKATIHDVAAAAGTSISTVSRVLTGSANVRPAKHEAVLQAIDELDYSPNLLARSLKTRQTFSLGLVINNIQDAFYSAMAKGIQDYASQHDYMLILADTGDDPEREKRALGMLRDKGVDGIIFAPLGKNHNYIRKLMEDGVLLVAVDRELEGVALPLVLVDNRQGAFAAVSHLIEQGFRRIGLINSWKNVTTYTKRELGYRQALADASLEVDEDIVFKGGPSSKDGYEMSKRFLVAQPVPDAVFITTMSLGIGFLRALRESSLRIPEDMGLVIFDDFEAFSLMSPPITTVRQPEHQVGWMAAKMLVESIQSGRYEPETVSLSTRLMERQSSLSHKEVMP